MSNSTGSLTLPTYFNTCFPINTPIIFQYSYLLNSSTNSTIKRVISQPVGSTYARPSNWIIFPGKTEIITYKVGPYQLYMELWDPMAENIHLVGGFNPVEKY